MFIAFAFTSLTLQHARVVAEATNDNDALSGVANRLNVAVSVLDNTPSFAALLIALASAFWQTKRECNWLGHLCS